MNMQLTFKRPLTGVEVEILQLIADGFDIFEIAQHTKYAESSVAKIKIRMIRITQSKNTINMVAWGFRNGIIK